MNTVFTPPTWEQTWPGIGSPPGRQLGTLRVKEVGSRGPEGCWWGRQGGWPEAGCPRWGARGWSSVEAGRPGEAAVTGWRPWLQRLWLVSGVLVWASVLLSWVPWPRVTVHLVSPEQGSDFSWRAETGTRWEQRRGWGPFQWFWAALSGESLLLGWESFLWPQAGQCHFHTKEQVGPKI